MPGDHSGAWSFQQGLHGLNLSPDGDAERFLSKYGPRVLVASRKDDHAEVYILDRTNGLWSRDLNLFFGLHQACVDTYYGAYLQARANAELVGFTAAGERRGAESIQARKTTKHVEEMRKAIGALVHQVQDRGVEETVTWWTDITLCEEEDIDSNMSCIAATNGVIDLRTGNLLSPLEGRSKLCTTHNAIPDPYDPDASHEDVYRLFGHLPDEHAGYFFAEFGYSLHGRPTRRFLMIISPPKTGKSTIVDALTDALGPLVARAPNTSIARSRRERNEPDPNAYAFTSPYRLTIMEEVQDIRVSEDVLKERTGDSRKITFRGLNENPSSHRPTATPVLLGNNTPQSLGLSDPAVMDRCKPLPYDRPKTPDPELRYAWSDLDKIAEEKQDAQIHRQALVAELVRNAVIYPPGTPPAPPPAVKAIIQSWEDDDLGEVGRWLMSSLSPEEGAYTVIDHVWETLVETIGQDKDGKVQGWVRNNFSRRLNTMLPDLPPATQRRENGRKRGWDGWRFAPVVDYDETEFEDSVPDTSAMFS